MSDPGRPAAAVSTAYERAQALLMLLPCAVFAWPGPGALLVGDIAPEPTGTGVLALGSMLCAALVGVRRVQLRFTALTVFLMFLGASAIALKVGAHTDQFEASRAMLIALSGLALLMSGASLGEVGRAVFARGVVALSIVFVAGAMAGVQMRASGTLGNTGTLSEAALPGALVGVWLFASSRGIWKWIGFVAALLYAGYVASTPVLAGAISLAAVIGLALLRAPNRKCFALAAASVVLIGAGASFLSERERPSADGSSFASSHLGGFEVRKLLWPSALKLLVDHPLTGTGPGQFRAQFPPHRDPREIELSLRNLPPGIETEVEHAHNDWLQGALDTGSIGGLPWIVFLLLVAAAAWRALGDEDAALAGLAAALAGLLLNALVRAPLLFNPASAGLFFGAAGVVASRRARAARAGSVAKYLPWAAAVLLAIQAPRATAMIRHGLALHLPGQLDYERALAACPDSPQALAVAARAAEGDPKLGLDAAELWKRVLEHRPHQFEALMELARWRGAQGRNEEARKLWNEALLLQPEHRPLLKNLALLELRTDDEETAATYLDRMQPTEQDRFWFERQGAQELLEGRERAGLVLLERALPEIRGALPEVLYQRSRELLQSEGHIKLANALESQAHCLWAREHAEAKRFGDAVRSYRQALRPTTGIVKGGVPRLRLELAAALLLDGHEDEAREELQATTADPYDWTGIPTWAGEALRKAHLFGSRKP
jgi:O-antigen ligase